MSVFIFQYKLQNVILLYEKYLIYFYFISYTLYIYIVLYKYLILNILIYILKLHTLLNNLFKIIKHYSSENYMYRQMLDFRLYFSIT